MVVIFPNLFWMIVRFLLRILSLSFSRHRMPKYFVRTPRTYRPMANWVIVYTNAARKRLGMRPLKRHLYLQSSAQGHSDWMAQTGLLSHYSHHDSTPHLRILESGYAGRVTGENIYKYPIGKRRRWLAKQLVDGWMRSPGHRANILRGSFSYIGIGLREACGYVWATQNFGGT